MKKQFKFCLLSVLLISTGVQAQVSTWYNKTHRQVALSATSSTRLDTLVLHSYVVIDSLIRFAQLNGYYADTYSSLSTALDAANSATSRKYVVLNSAKSITSNYTIPATVGLVIEPGGTIAISSGVTLTINGPFYAPPNQQVFSGSGTVQFGLGTTDAFFSEWFGAKNDSTTDSGAAIKKALDAMPNGGKLYMLPTGVNLIGAKGYIVNTTVRFPSQKNTSVIGNGTVIYSSASDTVFMLNNGSQTTIPSSSVSPAVDQPRHNIDGLRFKRITGNEGTGTAIALVNTTGASLHNIDVYDYNNAIVFSNVSSGWCENNDLYNWRIAACDTAILYKVTLSGNNSFATNSLRKVTMTEFTNAKVIRPGNSQAVGIYSNSGSNLYRNVWDQVAIFPTDSTTCVNIDGKAEDVTGSLNIEYIGSTPTTRMRGFHFGSNSSELRFKLHMNLTGRIYFPTGLIFYSQIPGSFGYSGITTTFDGNHNHGTEVVVDSTKFTPIYSIVRNNNRITKSSPGDSARIFFANVNNSDTGKLDLRARRNAPIEIRSITDNTYSAATANSVGGSALPLQPVRLLDIGANRTVNDSTTIDVRNTTHLIVSDNNSTIDSLKAFKGGIAGQTLTVTFSSSKTRLANLIGGTGTGRLFLLENDHVISQSGMKSFFKCESETGGVFWREMWRSAESSKTTDYTSTVDSIDVSQVNYIRFNRSVLGNIRNFYNGIDGQMLTTLDRTGNSTYLHLGKGTTKGISLIGGASRRDSSGTRHIFVYDGQEDLWREISVASVTNTGGSGWNDTGALIQLETTTDNISVGGTSSLGKFGIDGDTNEKQLVVQGNGTQTANLAEFESSAGTDILTVEPSNVTIGAATSPTTATNTLTIANGTAPTANPTNAFTLRSSAGEAVIRDGNGTISTLTNAWGGLYMSNATNVISTSGTAGTWVKVTGFTLETSPAGQGITAVADSFTVTVAGVYEISVSVSLHGGTASVDNYKIVVAKNSVANTNYQATVTTSDNSSVVNMSFTGQYNATSVGDDYSLLLTNTTDGDDPTIKQASFTIKRIN